jgi:cytochrome c556
MNRAFATAGIAVMVAAAAVGCAKMGIGKMKAEEAIPARQQLMKEQGAAMKSMQDKLKAGDTNVAAEAHKLVQTSKRIPNLFPEGSVDPKTSRAKPEIWQKWSEFQANAKSLEAKAGQVEASAKGGANAQALNTAVTDLGRTTCGACHNSFRGPEIKKS